MSRGEQFGVTPWGKAVRDKVVSSGGRLDRGLTLARGKDKVFDTQLHGNVVTTKVKGNSRPYYNVRSEWRTFSAKEKRTLLTLIRSNLLWLGRILNGDLPLPLLASLEDAGIALLPKSLADMGTSCDCPDAAGFSFHGAAALGAGQACKHQAALVFMVIAEIDKNAFQLFTLRGVDLVKELGQNCDRENEGNVGIQNRLLLTHAQENLREIKCDDDGVICFDTSDSEGDPDFKPEKNDSEDADVEQRAARKKILPLRPPKLQNQAKLLLSCLPESPAFCTRVDFKLVMQQFFAHVSKKRTIQLVAKEADWEKALLEEDENGHVPLDVLEKGFRRSTFLLKVDPSLTADRAVFSVKGPCFENPRMIKAASLVSGARVADGCMTVGAVRLLRLLQKMKDCDDGPSPSYLYFRNVSRAAYWLFLSNSYVPSIIPVNGNSHAWLALFVPFMGQKGQPIAQLVASLQQLYPSSNPVVFRERRLNSEAGTEQTLAILITALVHLVKFNPKSPANKAPKPIINAIFHGEVMRPLTLRDQSAGASVQRWFGVLDLLKLDVDVDLRLERTDETYFTLRLLFRSCGNNGAFQNSREFFAKGLTEPAHFSAIQFIASIAMFLPGNSKRLLSRGNAKLTQEDLEKFLLEQSPALRALGIKLTLPKGMDKVYEPRVVVRARQRKQKKKTSSDQDDDDEETKVKKLGFKVLKLDDLVDFDASIAIGDVVITMEEFEELVQQGRRVMEFRGKFLQVTAEEAQNLLAQARERQKQLDNGVDVPTALDLMKASLGKNFKSLTWLDEGLNQQMEELFASDAIGHPQGMNCTLRPYQIKGFEWLVATTTKMGGALLADDMGLGKTIQSIALLHHQKSLGVLSPQTPGLIVAPTSLMTNWASEIERFAPGISTNIYCGSKRNLRDKADIVLTTYTTAWKDLAKLGALDLSVMIIDEAQNIKNHSTQTAKSIKQLGKKKTLLRVALTGTPVENRLSELHSIFEFILPGWFPKAKRFQQEYSKPIQESGDQEAVMMLKMMTSPFMMRRLKTDLLKELPPKVVNDRFVTLSKVSRTPSF